MSEWGSLLIFGSNGQVSDIVMVIHCETQKSYYFFLHYVILDCIYVYKTQYIVYKTTAVQRYTHIYS